MAAGDVVSQTVYVDLETGGVEPQHPDIQLAAIAVDDQTGNELAAFEAKLKFDLAEADPEALAINGYTPEAWRNAIGRTECVLNFAKWVTPYRCLRMISKRTNEPYNVAKLAGHNIVAFDLPRLRRLFGPVFFPFSYHAKDTLQRALWHFDEHPELPRPDSLKLSALCKFFGLAVDGAHDALADVRMAAALALAIRAKEMEIQLCRSTIV